MEIQDFLTPLAFQDHISEILQTKSHSFLELHNTMVPLLLIYLFTITSMDVFAAELLIHGTAHHEGTFMTHRRNKQTNS